MRYNVFLMAIFIFSAVAFSQEKDSLTNYTDINGMKQGYWLKTDVDGNKIFEGTFKNNIPIGDFKRYHKNGVVKAQMLYDLNDQKRVYTKLFDDTGELSAEGSYYNKLKDGLWKYYCAKTVLCAEESYKMGQRDGVSKVFYSSGKLMEEKSWKDGKKEGAWIWYYENGTTRLKSMHKDDLRVGEFFIYHPNGQVEISGFYKADYYDGIWKFFNDKGAVEKEMKFKKGKADNQEELDKKMTEEINEMEKAKGTIPDPAEYIDNPMQYIKGVE